MKEWVKIILTVIAVVAIIHSQYFKGNETLKEVKALKVRTDSAYSATIQLDEQLKALQDSLLVRREQDIEQAEEARVQLEKIQKYNEQTKKRLDDLRNSIGVMPEL